MSTTQLAPATTYPALLGYVLLYQRKQAGLSQGVMAEAMDLSPSTLSRIERGEIALTVEQLARAASTLKTTPGEIVHMADRVARAARERGLRVEDQRLENPVALGLAIVGIAVLAAILMAVLAGKASR